MNDRRQKVIAYLIASAYGLVIGGAVALVLLMILFVLVA